MKKKWILMLLTLLLAVGLGMTAYGAEASDPQNTGDSSLSYLRVLPGKLTPEFTPEVTEYEVTVEPNHTKLAVTAKTTADSSKFVVSNTYLEVGTNIITVKVTAADGSLTTYTLHVLRPEDGNAAGESQETAPPETTAPITQAQVTDKGESKLPVWVFFLAGLLIGGIVLIFAVKMATKQMAMMEEDEEEEEKEELEFREIEAVEEPNPSEFFEFLDEEPKEPEEPQAEESPEEPEKEPETSDDSDDDDEFEFFDL